MYDLIIIGGGPAGYHAAKCAGQAGMQTALIEKGELGGVCLNEGCIPSKALLHCSKLYYQALHSQPFGIYTQECTFNLPEVIERKKHIIITNRKGIAFSLKKAKVTIIEGAAIIGPSQGGSFVVQVNGKEIKGQRLLICSGSEPIVPPLPGIELPLVAYNREILAKTEIPKKLVVIGGGAIGLELATFFAEIGSTVSVIEMVPTIGGPIDKDIAKVLKGELTKKGITIKTETKALEIKNDRVIYEEKGAKGEVETDCVLVSIGRRPSTNDIGLENIGCEMERGACITDEQGRTKVQNLWAAGDCNGKSMLAHTAYREAEVCIDSMLGKDTQVNYQAIPSVIYTHPEVAMVGLTQAEAESKGINVEVVKVPLSINGRYLAESAGERGLCKLIIDKEKETFLGAHLIGSHCSEMIYGMAFMIEKGISVSDFRETTFPHPTVSEVLKDALHQ